MGSLPVPMFFNLEAWRQEGWPRLNHGGLLCVMGIPFTSMDPTYAHVGGDIPVADVTTELKGHGRSSAALLGIVREHEISKHKSITLSSFEVTRTWGRQIQRAVHGARSISGSSCRGLQGYQLPALNSSSFHTWICNYSRRLLRICHPSLFADGSPWWGGSGPRYTSV